MSASATLTALFLLPTLVALASCSSSRCHCGCQSAPPAVKEPPQQRLVVSISYQKMLTYDGDKMQRRYPVSTSRFGVGDKPRSNFTPLGQ